MEQKFGSSSAIYYVIFPLEVWRRWVFAVLVEGIQWTALWNWGKFSSLFFFIFLLANFFLFSN